MPKSNINILDVIENNQHATLITEIKFSSPSLGKIRKIQDPVNIAKMMEGGGASALSVLTQPHLFDGSPEYFMQIRKQVQIPMLMKDIIVNNVQIDAAKKIGADIILLIQSLFDQGHLQEIDEYIDYAHKNELLVLLESHTKSEFENSQKTDADLLGINNRNLDTLDLDIKTTPQVLEGYSKSKPIISESGIEKPEDIMFLHKCGADAFLIGSSVMKSSNMKETVRGLVNSL